MKQVATEKRKSMTPLKTDLEKLQLDPQNLLFILPQIKKDLEELEKFKGHAWYDKVKPIFEGMRDALIPDALLAHTLQSELGAVKELIEGLDINTITYAGPEGGRTEALIFFIQHEFKKIEEAST